ncbi:MAG: ribosomal RNA small subunit methyltransferase A [Flavobacteriales bacterium]|nr:ribosomal RNA small subunit methyltransferase A [Flavobacteriales bacterium]|tara:strand:- start:1001 stop:1795 length:795 start_codon:yes stop_codon:yes gene_type:complete
MKQQLNISKNLPKKSLGQNFIKDKNFLDKLSGNIKISKKDTLIEIGPGKGALTKYLLENEFKKIYLIEKDRNLYTNLKLKYSKNNNVELINSDALSYDYSKFKNFESVVILGNLPFNISSQLLIKWLDGNIWPSFFSKMILMFQKEVGERILASHNSKKYGKLSILTQTRCNVKKIISAPSSIFYPKPKVDGMVIQFEPIVKYKNINFEKLKLLVGYSFQHRRKKLKNSLKDYRNELHSLKIDENLRAENLSVADYCNLVSLID